VSTDECEFGEPDAGLPDGQMGIDDKSCEQLKRHGLKTHHTTFFPPSDLLFACNIGIRDSDRDPTRLLAFCSCDYGIAVDRDWD
jgi:hypothetical protein